MVMPRRGASPRPRSWLLAGVLATSLIALADLTRNREVLLSGVLAGPLVAAIGASATGVAFVAVYATILAVLLGEAHDIFGTSDHVIRVAVVVAAGICAVVSARLRERRDEELAVARPQAADARRLRLALEAGQMGTWHWDLRSGKVTWDERLEALFGLQPRTFDGSFSTYESLLHPEDRERALAAVRNGMERNTGWQFDHRVIWPDGSVHWLDGRGEPEHDATGAVVGATGVTINVDARRTLLEVERRARTAAEQSSFAVRRLADISTALTGAVTVADVADVIVGTAVEALRARSGYFATVDEGSNELVMRAQSGYPDWIVEKYSRVDLDADVAGAEAVRTSKPIFIESEADRHERYPQYSDDPAHPAFVVVPLPPIDGTRAVLAFGFAEPRHFDDDDRRFIGAVVDACAQALQRATAYEAEKTTRYGLRLLLDSSEQLGALDDPELVVETIAQMAATRIGVWATVVAIQPDGSLHRAAVAHRDPSLAPLVREVLDILSDDGNSIRQVLEKGAPLLFHGLTNDAADALGADDELRAKLERIGYASCLLVPITIAGRRLAVLAIGDDRPDQLNPNDVALAVDLGRRGASALERAQLWQASQQRFEAEHRIVELLQRTIVPDRLPVLPNVRLAAGYRPAEVDVDVGGDWYDAFDAPDGSIVIVVGDVAGHGIQAASLMGRVRNALRAYAAEDPDPATILLRLHRLLRAQDSAEMVTAFVARHDPKTHLMSWSRAGHPPPCVLSPDGSVRFLDDVNGAPLGTMARAYETAVTPLPPGSLLVCYTDGLIERRDRVLDDGIEWLRDRVQQYADDDVETLCDKLVDDPFVPHPSPDDICVLVLRTEDE